MKFLRKAEELNWALLVEHGTSAALLLFALTIFCRHLVLLWGFTVDDSFITFRYSQNIVNGIGPVFNAGSRDEGYTSPLWMLLLILPHLAKLNAETFSKILGVACIFGNGVLAVWWAFRLTKTLLLRAWQPRSYCVLGRALFMPSRAWRQHYSHFYLHCFPI